jgi:hypothetical protein
VFGKTFGKDVPFSGDPIANLQLTARKLKSHGTGANAAARYAGGQNMEDRRKQYKDLAPSLKKYFDCFNKKMG